MPSWNSLPSSAGGFSTTRAVRTTICAARLKTCLIRLKTPRVFWKNPPIGASGDAHYIVSEFVEGRTLREHVKESPMELSEVLEISIQIANALSAAHGAHIVHRDIKPENIMIRSDGYAKILDFGLAKLVEQKVIGLEDATAKQNETAKGVILGTVNYMSPEQAKGERVDAGTDIFSFGVLVYEMIAGRTPFAGNTMSETFANLINSEPQPLSRYAASVPTELQRIVAKMLKKNKDERYQTAKDLLIDLKSLKKRLEFEAELERSSSPDKQREVKTQFFKADAGETKRTPAAQTNSVAVLPFANMSNDAENEYFCDGLAEELLNALAKIENLNVAARTSAFSFKNKNTNVSEIGNILNVNTILEGSVRKSDNRLRITVQLINAADGSTTRLPKRERRWNSTRFRSITVVFSASVSFLRGGLTRQSSSLI